MKLRFLHSMLLGLYGRLNSTDKPLALSLSSVVAQYFTGRFLDKFVVKWILKIPPHLAYVATQLPCETLMSAKHVINDKLHRSVATYLRCRGLLITKLGKVYC